MKTFGIIYKVTNIINNKIYIGQTINSLNNRKKRHYNHINDGSYFHNALLKYEKENWKWEQIDTAYSREELDKKEKYWIEFYDTFDNKEKGYNLTSGGEHNKSYSFETRKKIGIGNKGKIITKECKEKISKALKGRIFSNEHKRNLSKALCGKNNGMYGKKHSIETKLKISNSCKGRKLNDHQIKIIKQTHAGKFVSEETRKKISESKKGKSNGPFTEEHKQKLRKANIGGKNPMAKKIICVNTGEVYDSIQDASKKLDIHYKQISRICLNKKDNFNGLKFQYYEK